MHYIRILKLKNSSQGTGTKVAKPVKLNQLDNHYFFISLFLYFFISLFSLTYPFKN